VKKIYFFCFFILSAVFYPQAFTYRSYNVNNGLPSSQTFDVMQDKQKYIWISSDRGACRFDGYTFINYTTEHGLLDNSIFKLYEDPFNRIWFLSYSGKLSYYLNGKVYPYKYNSLIQTKPNQAADLIRSFSVLEDSSVIIGSVNNGLIKITNTGKKEILSLKVETEYANSLFLMRIGDTYYFAGKRPPRPSKEGYSTSYYAEQTKIFEEGTTRKEYKNVYFLRRKNQHVIYASFGKLFDIYNDKIHDTLSLNNEIISLYEDSDSCLWVGKLDGGVCRYKPNRSVNDKCEIYFPQNNITKILEDYEHGFWFTTLHNGVIYVPSINIETLEYYENNIAKEKSVVIATDYRSNFFVGTNMGNIKIFSGGKITSSLYLNREKTIAAIKTIFYDSCLKKLYVFDTRNVYSVDEKGKSEIINSGGMISFQRDHNKILYAGGFANIMKDFPKNKNFNIINPTEVTRSDVMCVDKNNRVWIGNANGLYYIEGDNIKKYEKTSSLNVRITSLTYINNTMYIGTIGNGIIIWKDDHIEIFDSKKGLPSNFINVLQVINDSILWAATPQEVCKINTKQNKVLFKLNYNKGICNNEVKDIKVLNDTLYFLSYNGISFFNLNKIFINQTPPAIYIQDLRVDTTSYIQEKDPVLSHNNNYITINVTGLSYRQSGKTTYKYRLLGYSDIWRNTISNSIQFAFVPPGTYTFEVVAENEDGICSKEPAVFKFTISEPIWNKLWFQILILLLLVIIISLVSYYRLKRVKEKNKMMEQLAGFKQQALAMQMNPHFIFNSLSSIQSYVLSEKPLKASKYLALFSKLMRTSLENSRKEFINIEEEINTLQLYIELESVRTKNLFSFHFDYDDHKLHSIMIPPMLVQPHIENAIKHGLRNSDTNKQGIIKISFHMQNDFLYCKIEDNGIGYDKALEIKKTEKRLHQSTGIDVTKTRLELLCHNLGFPFIFSINDKLRSGTNDTGTIVEFLIPYIHETKGADS
jgi:hypothetical protein